MQSFISRGRGYSARMACSRQMGRWAGGQVGRWAGGQRVYVLAINGFACCSLVFAKRKPKLELEKMFCCLFLSLCNFTKLSYFQMLYCFARC
jgi:hypothetical protein